MANGFEKPVRKTIKISEAAQELGVSVHLITDWIKGGLLPVFVPPGKTIGSCHRGPKGFRIFLDDWERFKSARTQVVIPGNDNPSQPKAQKKVPATGLVTGTDGIRRRRVINPKRSQPIE